ncbi:MAG: sigma-54 dependent transcriptional regulator [Desulfobulbaceae bacterium]|nr:sigma-54 dependent transcriptional regulator [Desulfobulbaceae bacterium]
MLVRLVFALREMELQRELEERFSPRTDVQVGCYGQTKNPLQKVVQSCGDVIVIGDSLLPRPVESAIAMLNNLPENPTTVVLHDYDSAKEHAQLMAAGADVVLYSKIPPDILVEAIDATLESRRQLVLLDRYERRGIIQPKLNDFVSNSEVMRMFINDVQLVAPSDSVLLIMGETGVGKEHLAKAIHAESSRAGKPFVALNAAALPEQLLESELFGHEKGAFTGATRSRRGAFEQAHGGTIFLDEIGEMPLHLQTKLLRVLQDYEVRPVGGDKSIWVDVRVIAATNRELEEEIVQGNFRRDLYYRLGVMTLRIPPLRERRDDIPALTRRFMNYYRYKIGRDITHITDQTLQALYNYDWPGNVRELMNVIERAMLICKTDEITLQDLPGIFHKGTSFDQQMIPAGSNGIPSWHGKTLPEVHREVLDQVDSIYLKMVLTETGGRIGKAAEIAGINSRGLYNKMKKLGLKKEDFKNR